ncbi:MAG TPA: type II secretion system F family protein [Candidatus Methylacidiphilales bacterium]|jgi:tight adherence protein C|nr:type II secretion system F family protein [Candidatus Methylacidiphilales bacterium]
MDPIFILICICFLGAVLLAGFALHPSAETTSISQRLEGLKAGQQQQRSKTSLRDEEEMGKSVFVRIILPIVDKTSRFFSQITPITAVKRARISIIQAGMQGRVTPERITSFSYILLILLPVTIFPTAQMMGKGGVMTYAIIGIAALLGYRLPFGYVQGKAQARQHEIRKALPFTLDLISISVEAGMALDGAMAIVQEKSTGPMADELGLTLREIRLGKGRNEALVDMGDRIGLEELKSFVTAVTYIARLGGSLVDVIRIQAQAMRIKRRQRAEEKAMKTPVKIMIPLVLFIFPSMFIVILGPAAITMMEQMKSVPGH